MLLNRMSTIGQFRQIIKNIQHQARFVGFDNDGEPIYDSTTKMPVLTVNGAVKVHGCFEKNTLITLANGEDVPINKIKKGSYVLSYNIYNSKLTENKVLKTINQKLDKSWCKLIFDKTEIICTKDHKIYTENRGYIEAKNLKNTDVFKTID